MAKNRYLAAFLSFLIAGLGQLYVGKYKRAAVYFIIESTTSYLYLKNSNSTLYLALNFMVGVASMIDAYETAKKTGENSSKGKPAEKPKEADEEQKDRIINIKAY